jgi:hypothetical protein
MNKSAALVFFFAVAAPAFAWNDKGHMVSARLAWRKLSQGQRSKVIEILKKHPHYNEYLSAKQPKGFSADEWVFLRAATWPDWVRTHHKAEYHHGPWHYINYPFVPPGSSVDPKQHQPPSDQENIRRFPWPRSVTRKTRGGPRGCKSERPGSGSPTRSVSFFRQTDEDGSVSAMSFPGGISP